MLRSRIPSAARVALHARRVAPTPLAAAPRFPQQQQQQTRAVNTSAVGTNLVKDNGDTVTLRHPEEYFQAYKTDIPSLEHDVSKQQLVQIYNDMVSMRRMEMACDQVRLCSPRFVSGPRWRASSR